MFTVDQFSIMTEVLTTTSSDVVLTTTKSVRFTSADDASASPPAAASVDGDASAASADGDATGRVSLLQRLGASADARHAAICASRPKQSVRVYKPYAWLELLFSWRSRGLRMILTPMLLIALVAGIVTPLIVLRASEETCETLGRGSSAFTLVLSAMSFLLVFRLNRAALRHYEARQLCGWIIIHCRDIAMAANAALGKSHPEARDQLCELAVAFPVCFMLHIWGNPDSRADVFARMLDGVFADATTFETIQRARHRPLALIEHGEVVLHEIFHRAQDARVTDGWGDHAVYSTLMNSVQGLGVPLGGCERIQGTPLPYIYVAHLRSFLLTVLTAIPLVYACEWRWATIPLSLLIGLALLGVEAASIECERPFAATPTKNHHDIERFAVIISSEVYDMLERSERRSGRGAPSPASTVAAAAAKATPVRGKLVRSGTLYGLK